MKSRSHKFTETNLSVKSRFHFCQNIAPLEQLLYVGRKIYTHARTAPYLRVWTLPLRHQWDKWSTPVGRGGTVRRRDLWSALAPPRTPPFTSGVSGKGYSDWVFTFILVAWATSIYLKFTWLAWWHPIKDEENLFCFVLWQSYLVF